MSATDAAAMEVAERKSRETEELVARIRSGDLEAFEGLIRLHERRLLGMAVQMGLSPADAQDACQEVFLRVFRYLGRFRAGQRFEAWLWRIAVNVVYDSLRSRRDRGEVPWDGLLQEGQAARDGWGGLQVSVENADICAKLLARMEVLTQQERMVFVLKELQDMDTPEIARAMGISAITVRRHKSSALQKLRKVVTQLGRVKNPEDFVGGLNIPD
ncbi:MAG TPA: RNA polymerase sigma factor [Candidatus Polarisedimenticolia bacterium]|jgi:RNA polymerase sigma-70 factor (ECF subfamily)|nr:RNA polymerase sigma factor [Candidatus Polarisedimenticolia bacterium]